MRSPVTLTLLVLLATACHKEPTSPPPDRGRDSGVSRSVGAAAFPACTRHWRLSASGTWSLPANWSPVGIPGPADVVCIDAPGSYTVTFDADLKVEALVIGDLKFSSPTVELPGAVGQIWDVPTGIDLQAGSLVLHGPVFGEAGYVRLAGATTVTNSFIVEVDSLANFGSLTWTGGAFAWVKACPNARPACNGNVGIRNAGTITGTSLAQIDLGGGTNFLMEGGAITPTLPIMVSKRSLAASSFVWSGGSLADVTTAQPPVALYQGMNLRFPGGSPSGTISGFGMDHVTGDIPAGVVVWAVENGLHPTTSFRSTANGPLTNRGVLNVLGTINILAGPGIVNEGTLLVQGGPDVQLDSLVNAKDATMTVDGSIEIPTLLRNRGTLTVSTAGPLDVVGTFVSEGGATQSGQVTVHRGVISGSGTLGNVSLFGGRLDPGGTAVGALQLSSLTMDAGSTLAIDVRGTAAGTFDALTITGAVVYDGTLALRELAPFQAGSCGQVVTVATDQSGMVARKGFARLTGAAPGAGRGWRTWLPTGALQLVGHDPALAVSLGPIALTVTEGGAAQTYSVCLRAKPAAPVTVSPAGTTQLVLPSPAVFQVAAWALPRQASLSALNDALVELSPQVVSVTHKVTSTDPAYNQAPVSPLTVSVIDNDGTTNHELAVTSAPPVVTVGQSFTMTFQDFNDGPDASVGATFSVPVRAGFTFVSATGTTCTSDAVTGTTCQLGGIAAGGALAFSLTFQAVAVGSYATPFTVSTVQADPNLGNNTRTVIITIN